VFRPRGVHDACAKHDDIANRQRVFPAAGAEHDVALDDVNADRCVGIVGRHVAGRGEGEQRETQRSFLHQSARGAPVLGEERRVDRLLIAREVMNEDIAFQHAVE